MWIAIHMGVVPLHYRCTTVSTWECYRCTTVVVGLVRRRGQVKWEFPCSFRTCSPTMNLEDGKWSKIAILRKILWHIMLRILGFFRNHLGNFHWII
jgi:hypothetical protein